MAGRSSQRQLRSPLTNLGDESFASTYQLPPHIFYIDEVLQRLVTRELSAEGYVGVIIEVPPRHGKSELCSHNLPAWYLGAFPDEKVILCSYEADFAASWGRKARNTLDRWGPRIFGTSVDQRSSAADRWEIKDALGGMITAGVGGAITGRGGNVIIVDDPVKNAQEANSKIKRDATWAWWTSTARTRLEPGGVILIIMTRWHEDDLAGRLIEEMDKDPVADQFLRITFPAICESQEDILGRGYGDALWPERFPVRALDQIQASVGSYVWSALFQQRPAPKENAMFQREWFPIIPARRRAYRKVVRRWDFAATEAKKGEFPDFTACVKMGIVDDEEFHILDVQRMQGSPKQTQRLFKEVTEQDGRGVLSRIEQERGSAGKQFVYALQRLVGSGYSVKGVLPSGEKEVRAAPYSACAERGEVHLIGAPWNQEFLGEHETFPFGRNDDQVDAAAGAFEDLTGRRRGTATSWG